MVNPLIVLYGFFAFKKHKNLGRSYTHQKVA
jgi:hypothetical protein